MEQSVGDDQGVNPEEEKAARRTLRAMKKVQSAPATESVAPLAEGSFSATIRHFSGLFLCHKVGERKLGAVHDIDESCLFVFEPFKDVQMGRPRFGWRVKTAQGAFLVAVLGRRCTSRLVMQNEVPLPGAGDAHNKFFMEQTNLFEIDDKIGGLRYQFHSSENDDDVFYFAFAPVSCREIVNAECTLKKDVGPDWRYVVVERR